MTERVILTDCDGVLLDWNAVFVAWMADRGLEQRPGAADYYNIRDRFELGNEPAKKYTKLFNESAAIGYLPPYRDSQRWVSRLHELGYKFVVITSLSHDPYARQAREANLLRHFGDVFLDIQCLDTGADKTEALSAFRDSGHWWIEDKIENARAGQLLGLQAVVLRSGQIQEDPGLDGLLVADSWADVANHVTGQSS